MFQFENKPFEPVKLTKDHLQAMIAQASICKNYFAMTEIYLKLVESNIDVWHLMYVNDKH